MTTRTNKANRQRLAERRQRLAEPRQRLAEPRQRLAERMQGWRTEARACLDLPALLLAGFLLAGVSTIVLADRPSDLPPPPPPGDPGGGGGPPSSLDEEAVGSLPMTGGGLGWLSPEMAPPGLQPSLYVEGPTELMLDAVLQASGRGVLRLDEAGPGRSTILFHGQLEVDFAASLFFDESVEAGIVTGVELGHVAAGIVFQDRLVARRALRADETLELPLHEMLELELLKGGVDIFTVDLLGGRDRYHFVHENGIVSLSSH